MTIVINTKKDSKKKHVKDIKIFLKKKKQKKNRERYRKLAEEKKEKKCNKNLSEE